MRKKLEEVYETGDEIYIVGFSRGAASARKFACELNTRGLRNRNNLPVPIQFLGCFDTISMQYWKNAFCIWRTELRPNEITKSRVLGETDGKIPPNVATAVHHIALDDARFRRVFPVPFPPVFMDSHQSKVHEVYFPGDHGGVGGNHYLCGMSDNSCKVMQEWLEKEHLKFLEPEKINEQSLTMKDGCGKQISLEAKDVAIRPDPTINIDFMDGYKRKKPSHRPVITVTNEKAIEGGIVKIHVSALQHYKAMKQQGTSYEFNPNIRKANIVIVDNLQHEMNAETKEFKGILGI